MPFTVNDFRDLLRILEEHPEWRAEMRRALLDDELLQLPQLVARLSQIHERTDGLVQTLVEQVAQLGQRVEQLTEQVARLTQHMEEIGAQVAVQTQQIAEHTQQIAENSRHISELTETVRQLLQQMQLLTERVNGLVAWQRGETGRREGERYERHFLKRALLFFRGGQGGTTDSLYVQQQLARWLSPLLEQDTHIEADNDPTLADLIWWKNGKVLVVEVSLKVSRHDVVRSHQRAQTLRAAGVDAVPVVVGERWTSAKVQQMAQAYGVEWIIRNTPSAGIIAFRRMSV